MHPRTISQIPSRNPSPAFDPGMSQPTVIQAKQNGRSTANPAPIGIRASTASAAKATSLPESSGAVEEQKARSVGITQIDIAGERSVPNEVTKARSAPPLVAPVPARLEHSSLVVRTRKKEDKVQRLKRHIKQAQHELQSVLQETPTLHAMVTEPTSEAEMRRKFDQYVLEL